MIGKREHAGVESAVVYLNQGVEYRRGDDRRVRDLLLWGAVHERLMLSQWRGIHPASLFLGSDRKKQQKYCSKGRVLEGLKLLKCQIWKLAFATTFWIMEQEDINYYPVYYMRQ